VQQWSFLGGITIIIIIVAAAAAAATTMTTGIVAAIRVDTLIHTDDGCVTVSML
jgi:hypothetical protein